VIAAASPFIAIGDHREMLRRRNALAVAITREEEDGEGGGRCARIVGGGSQRGPTERRQQAESLAHSFSVPLARPRSLSLPPVSPPPALFLSLWPWSSFRFFPFPGLLTAGPLFVRLSSVVPYGYSAHPPVVAHSRARERARTRARPHTYARARRRRGGAGWGGVGRGGWVGDQESQVYGTH